VAAKITFLSKRLVTIKLRTWESHPGNVGAMSLQMFPYICASSSAMSTEVAPDRFGVFFIPMFLALCHSPESFFAVVLRTHYHTVGIQKGLLKGRRLLHPPLRQQEVSLVS
jgi:hypothetical protein